jgi:amino acid transporter
VLQMRDLRPHGSPFLLFAAFGTICYSLQGLDLASIMGDEIREPRKVLPGAIFWGGVISGAIYLGVTLSMLIALRPERIGVLSGVLQAVAIMADRSNLHLVVMPLALFEFIAILGTASAWFSGAARLPFVAGIDHYLPPALGKVHPRFHTPYVALCVFAVLSALLILMSYIGASVGEAYLTLLSIAVILQMVPNLYMFGALWKLIQKNPAARRRIYFLLNAGSGLIVSLVGLGLAFVPAPGTQSKWLYEAKLLIATATVFGSALWFYVRAQRARGLS